MKVELGCYFYCVGDRENEICGILGVWRWVSHTGQWVGSGLHRNKLLAPFVVETEKELTVQKHKNKATVFIREINGWNRPLRGIRFSFRDVWFHSLVFLSLSKMCCVKVLRFVSC